MATRLSEEELAQQARFIFRGTVERVHATTLANVAATSRTVVVRVDDVLQASPGLTGVVGQSITVHLAPRERVREGQQAVFYTNGWIFGESLAVRSIGHRPSSGVPAALAGPEADPAQQQESRDLQDRLSGAEVVVSGRVASVQAPPEPPPAGMAAADSPPGSSERYSEHAPLWRQAIVDVDSVEKGSETPKQVAVLFPASDDVLWYDVPKLEPGQEGVFILHRPADAAAAADAAGFAPTAGQQVYTIADPLDVRPNSQLGHIKQLINTNP